MWTKEACEHLLRCDHVCVYMQLNPWSLQHVVLPLQTKKYQLMQLQLRRIICIIHPTSLVALE